MAHSKDMHEVIVVGGGIAGASLAAVLARAGLDVLVLEKSETFADHVRGEALLQWGVAEAQRLGLLDALLAAGGHYLTRGFGYDEMRASEAVDGAPLDMAAFLPGVPGILAISHPRHCQALLDLAAAAGAEVLRDVRLLNVEAGQAATVSYEANGRQVEARTRLIVGADGRASVVRDLLNIPMSLGPPRTMLSGMLVEGAHGWDADAWTLGAENDFAFSVFPQGAGAARIYGWWDVHDRRRFSGPEGACAFLAAFHLECCPMAEAIAAARQAGPLGAFLNNETVAETPFIEGAVLIGDAAGWTDPLSGCGLSSAYRDARIVSEILLTSDDWSAAAFAPYAQERNERLRRLRFITELESALICDFEQRGRARRRRYIERLPDEPMLASHLIANLAGPEMQPAEVFTPAHRAFVLGDG